jgi:hypothetical protein
MAALGAAGLGNCGSFLLAAVMPKYCDDWFTHHAGVTRFPASLALCNFLTQIWEAHIGAIALN